MRCLLQKVPKLKLFSTLAVATPIEQTQQNETQTTSSCSGASQAIVPLIQQSVSSVFCTPTIVIDDTGSSSSYESDKKEVHLSKRTHVVDANEVINILEGRWLQIEKCILSSSNQMLLESSLRTTISTLHSFC